ncbi:MAG: F-type H+-transporting ATPase subunit b [Bacteroidia bacterium]|jgi:F-type H+-transporting ATPase subunit b
MLIDWFTVGAQVLNFLILVWLMKRFLYKPILNAIDAREQRIADELADADRTKTEAQKERDTFQQKNEAFDLERADLLKNATEDAKTEQQRLLDVASKVAVAMNLKRLEALRTEAHNLNKALARRTQDEVFAIARKALKDLGTVSLEAQMCDVFIRQLQAIDESTKNSLQAEQANESEPARVRSAFELPEEQRAQIQKAINETFSANIPLNFETTPDLISGIELTTNGQKVSWSIADYLTSLEKGIGELLKEQDKAKVNVEQTQPQLDAKSE